MDLGVDRHRDKSDQVHLYGQRRQDNSDCLSTQLRPSIRKLRPKTTQTVYKTTWIVFKDNTDKVYTLSLIPADPAAWTFDVIHNHFSIVASDYLFCDVKILGEPVWYPGMADK